MDPRLEFLQTKTRRHFLKESSLGLGSIAMASMNKESALAAPNENISNPLAPKQPHFKAKAKHVIYLHMTGSPPHLDLFDYKPELVKHDGEDCPKEFLEGKRFAFLLALT